MPPHTHRPAPPPPPPPPKPHGAHGRPLVIGGYEIEGELGRGGMGVVYLARHAKLNRHVALKMLSGHYGPDELQRFLAEAETAAGLHHTNIAHIYEVGEHEGAPFYAMEHVEGGSLADLLRKNLPEPHEAVQLLMPVARALHFAHQNGIVHRDMKPANILLDPEGVPKVADFGIAKRLKEQTKLTLSGAVVGTPTYMAPEQAKGTSREVGPTADVYSLGAILYEMLTGRPPFLPEESDTAMTVRVLTEDPVSPAFHRPGIPRDLEVICMKCLEKQPRDRYASAAAFAEDLRRFVDDEDIVARPPTSAVRTIKWVRRHPWKFVGLTVAAVLAVAGLVSLTQWELYGRLRSEYATEVQWVHGALEPVTKLSRDSASRSAAHVRLTRRGRLGPIVKAEVLNARGYPAVVRRLVTREMIPIYIEGIGGAQPYSEKTPETTTVHFLFSDGVAAEATGRDRNGNVIWRLIYDRLAVSPASGAQARFVNFRGFEAASRDGASHIVFERDEKGRDVGVNFFNAIGRPAANGEGVYGYRIKRDDTGRMTELMNLGANGEPAPNRLGVTGARTQSGAVRRSEPLDANGQPTVWNGISAVVTEHDAAGNPTRISNLAADGKPVRNTPVDWSVQELRRNGHGELVQRTFFKADAEGVLKQVSQLDVAYDEFGHPADLKFVGATSWRSALQHTPNGNVAEEKFLDLNGAPIVAEKGYSIRRATYTPGPLGLRVEETYFDPAGNKTYSAAGNHRVINEFDVNGILRRQTMDELDPATHTYHRLVSEPDSDKFGRMRRNVTRFENAEGELATNAGLLFAAAEEIYDDNGRVVLEWKLGCDVQRFGGPVLRIQTEWHSTGATKRFVRQVCDANRTPLSVLPNGEAPYREEEFDAIDQRERIRETGFDEAQVGFSTREAKFESGTLQSVTHKRADGTAVDAVRVLIKGLEPAQPKAAELRVGDQLLAINDQPITSAYACVFTPFPGGSVDVLREGQRLRIEGFEAGSVGYTLEDRAP